MEAVEREFAEGQAQIEEVLLEEKVLIGRGFETRLQEAVEKHSEDMTAVEVVIQEGRVLTQRGLEVRFQEGVVCCSR